MINVCPILERMSPIEILRPRSGKNLKFKVQKNVQEGIMMAIFFSNSTWKICVILSRQAAELFGLIDSKSTFFVQNLEYIETISDIPLFKTGPEKIFSFLGAQNSTSYLPGNTRDC